MSLARGAGGWVYEEVVMVATRVTTWDILLVDATALFRGGQSPQYRLRRLLFLQVPITILAGLKPHMKGRVRKKARTEPQRVTSCNDGTWVRSRSASSSISRSAGRSRRPSRLQQASPFASSYRLQCLITHHQLRTTINPLRHDDTSPCGCLEDPSNRDGPI